MWLLAKKMNYKLLQKLTINAAGNVVNNGLLASGKSARRLMLKKGISIMKKGF